MGIEGPYRVRRERPRPPPRRIPLVLWLMLRTGGTAALFGWGLLAVGSPVAWVFLPRADFSGWLLDWSSARVAAGVVEASWETAAGEDDLMVWAARYSFEDERGVRREGVSYGHSMAPGAVVWIEHLADDPVTSRIRGMRRAPFSPLVVWVLVFPVLGVGLAVAGWRAGRRPTELLVHGRLGHGVLVSKVATGARINKRTVFVMTFELEPDGFEPVRVEARTHHPELLEDDAREPLLYHPDDPTYATLLDHLPGGPRIQPDGEITLRFGAGTVGAIALPLATLVLNVLGLLSMLDG